MMVVSLRQQYRNSYVNGSLTVVRAIGNTAENLVLDSRIELCDLREADKKINDGNTNQLAVAILTQCSQADIEIHLDGRYVIHWVVLYGGTSEKNGKLMGEVVFVVDKFGLRSESCGSSRESRWRLSGRGVRVNCGNTHRFHKNVLIRMKSTPVLVAEVEAFTLAPIAEDTVSLYRGCFHKFDEMILIIIDDLNLCQKFCLERSFTVAAIKGHTRCYCSNNYDEDYEISMSYCDICPNSRNFCGGRDSYSVYLVYVHLPQYQGCLSETNLLKDAHKDRMTISKCLRYCDYSRYAVVAYGDACVCTNDTFETDAPFDEEKCNVTCLGDPENYCGGVESMAVFKTCLGDIPQLIPCSKIFRCLGSWDDFGVCTDGCQFGFSGDYCLERVNTSIEFRFVILYVVLAIAICFPIAIVLWSVNKNANATVAPQVKRSQGQSPTAPSQVKIRPSQ